MQLEIDLQWESAISKPQWLLILEAVFYIILVRVWQNNAIKEKKTFRIYFIVALIIIIGLIICRPCIGYIFLDVHLEFHGDIETNAFLIFATSFCVVPRTELYLNNKAFFG